MLSKYLAVMLLIVFGFVSCTPKMSVKKVFADAEKQTELLLHEIPAAKIGKPDLVSPRTLENGQLKLVTSRDWTSGFFPGVLWYLHEYTGKPTWKTNAQAFTANIEKEKTNTTTHDMGFKIYCRVGN